MNYEATKIRVIMELRREGITDTRVLAAIERTPRDAFVAGPFKDQAYENVALPISQGQTISQPFVVAYMTQALELGERMKALEIGTGSGYQTAVLSKLCRRVYTVERYKSLLDEAEERLRALRVSSVTARHGDGAKGWPELAPFERIVVTAAAEEAPQTLVDQLAEGGIMVLPLGPRGEQRIVRLRRTAEGIERKDLIAVRFVPLVEGAAK